MNEEIRAELESLAEPGYREFSLKLTPGASNILGVRNPQLREIAKRLAKGDWQRYLAEARDDSHEEVMLQGMVIGHIKAEPEQILPLVTAFVPKISNWAICDTFCTGLKQAKKYPDVYWEFIQPYLQDTRPYFIRFGVIMLLAHFVDEQHIDRDLSLFDSIQHDEYYVKMGAAWAVSVCFIKFPERTMDFLKDNRLDDFTYNKSLQKIIESRRVNDETKAKLRGMKRH